MIDVLGQFGSGAGLPRSAVAPVSSLAETMGLGCKAAAYAEVIDMDGFFA